MTRISYVEHSGREHVVDISPGLTLMEGAVKNLVPGITADCGGAGSCATCHVYVDGTWQNRLKPMDDMEKSMLDFAEGADTNSRLSCQIVVTDSIDGITVRLPRCQRTFGSDRQ